MSLRRALAHPEPRPFAASYFRETGRHVIVSEAGRAADIEYVAWLETKLAESVRREEILQGVRG